MFDLSRYSDRTHLKRRNIGSNAGWQFATKKKGFEETKFFGDSKLGGPDASYRAAIEYRDRFLAAARELGIADETGIQDTRLPIQLNLGSRNTSGINGVGRQTRGLRRGRKTPEQYWTANYKADDGAQKQEEFSINGLGEKEALYRAVKYRRDYVDRVYETLQSDTDRAAVAEHLLEMELILEAVAALEDSSEVFFFVGTLNNPLLNSTEKQDMLRIRIGQQRFRRLLLLYWNHRCVITGTSLMLTAGHIKPWAHASNTERLDVFNGFVLSPVYDRAFDFGFISFTNAGKILISPHFQRDALSLNVTGDECIRNADDRHHVYLAWHRENVLRKAV